MPRPRTGTMTQRAPGRWRLQVTGDPDPLQGTRRRLSRTVSGTRTEARAALQRMVVEVGAGLNGGASVTVGLLLEQFLVVAHLAPTTRQDWESVVRQHLVPSLGKLTTRDCDQLYAKMTAMGLGPSRVRCAHVVLHRAVAQAVRWGWLTRNPVSVATRPEVPRAIVYPPAIPVVRTLLAAAAVADPGLVTWLQIAVATGARRGEICALAGRTSTSMMPPFASNDPSPPPRTRASSSSPPKPGGYALYRSPTMPLARSEVISCVRMRSPAPSVEASWRRT